MDTDTQKTETIADILAEMRTEQRPYGISIKRLRSYADRIEAAAERERDSMAKPNLCRSCKHYLTDGCEICGCGDYVESDTIHPAPVPGNAAAMREALIVAKDNLDSMGANALEGELNPDAVALICARISARIDAALSKPARNCDRYGDEDDAFAAWHDALNDGDVVSVRNAFRWLFAPAEGGDNE